MCPAYAVNEYNAGLDRRAATYIQYPQAVPLAYAIDRETCLGCGLCEKVCLAGAINYGDVKRLRNLEVGAVILAPGYQVFDPSCLSTYLYGKSPNVVTSLELERILSPSGPYKGHVMRPLDREEPKSIAWLQCVGSRRVTPGENSYCSGVCCTYTQKQVILTKDHDPEAECTIFHNDIRSYGKDFEPYHHRAEQLPGIRFIRSYASIVGENPETKNVILRYATPDDGVKEEEFDMVVLSVGLEPVDNLDDLRQMLSLSKTSDGFLLEAHPKLEPVDLSVLLSDITRVIKKTAADKGVAFQLAAIGQMPKVRCDSGMIHSAVMDIVSNAFDACTWKAYPEDEKPEVNDSIINRLKVTIIIQLLIFIIKLLPNQ